MPASTISTWSGQALAQQAEAHHDRALQISRTIGHRQLEALSLGNLGALHIQRGDVARALTVLRRALAITKSIRDRWRYGPIWRIWAEPI